MKKIVSLLLIVWVGNIAMTSCSGKNTCVLQNTTWVIVDGKDERERRYTAQEFNEFYEGFCLTFQDDKKYVLEESGCKKEGSYSIKGNTITLTTENGTLIATENGEILSMKYDDFMLNLKKQ